MAQSLIRAWRRTVTRLCQILLAGLALPAAAANTTAPVHGLWIWKSSAVLQAPQAAPLIRSYCQSAAINEVYVSVANHYSALDELQFAQLIALLHQSGIRVEALISSVDGDEVGGPRTRLLDHVQAILQFNRQHAGRQFDGIHLDIEPQQRAENKGPGNLQFLPGLIDTYREVRVLTDRAGLTLNADIQNKVLKADLPMRRALLSALPRLTLMLYELSSPEDQTTTAQRIEKVRQSSQRFLQMAYEGLDDPKLARMAIALRTPDYGASLPQMLAALDEANHTNAHYLGWARHSYNDSVAAVAEAASP
jgi:hypothetical protein